MDWQFASSSQPVVPHVDSCGIDPNEKPILSAARDFPDFAERSQDLLCTHNLEGQLLSINLAPALVLGYSVEELLGKPMRDMVAPEFRDQFDEYLARIQRDGTAQGLICVLTRTGQRRIWEYFNTLQTDGVSFPIVRGVAHDVTERREAEKSLSLLRMLVDHSNDAIEVLDPKTLRFLDVNEKACSALGYTRKELLALRVYDIDPTMDESGHANVDAQLRKLGPVIKECVHRRKDGTTFPVEINAKLVNLGRDYVITVVHDITERKRAEIALRESEKRLNLLLKINNALVSKLELGDLFPAISSALQPVFQQDSAGISVYEPETNELRLCALDLPMGKELVGTTVPVSGSLSGEAFQANEIKLFRRFDLERQSHDLAAGLLAYGIQSVCCVPLKGRSGSIGVLSLGSKKEGAFCSMDFDLVSQVAIQVAIALDNARAYRNIEQLKEKLTEEKLYLENEIQTELHFKEIVGDSPALKEVLNLVTKVAASEATVLLLGETGTGKELVARAIHRMGRRNNKSFIKVNCAAVPAGLLESELFGHEKGAFTNAVSQKLGRVELADHGTLFLDEIGETPLELQPKLLRVLQEQEFERLGSVRTLRVNTRIIAATNRDLAESVANRQFRSDLFYRLNIFPIRMPALRERRADIPKLVSHFVNKHAERMNKHIHTIPSKSIETLMNWDWPGNIRELENIIERSVILTQGTVLQVPLSELEARSDADTHNALQSSEREHIVRALRESGGLIAGPKGAAVRLGLKRSVLQSKIQQLRILPQEYRRNIPRLLN